jgi:adenylosuccinate synthase
MTRYASVLGLGFGDCGKGRFIAALTRRWQAHTVARFNGGAQAGHNVVDAGRHHTFSQFGSGTFSPHVVTLLLDPVVVHPTALLVEAEALGRIGITDALNRLRIDGQCRLTTPYHQAAGRLRELLRGANAHGSCGVGVGETVRHSLEHPDETLRYRDLIRAPMDRVQAIRKRLLVEFPPSSANTEAGHQELRALRDEALATRWLTAAQALARHCPPVSDLEIHDRLVRPGCVLFEGAQGVLLDEGRGFHPHTTWSSTTSPAVERVARQFGISVGIEHYGVLRSYLTRHGAGPFPTHDPWLDALPELHNASDGWQGCFRRGHPDAVLLRYALEAIGKLSGLLISHLDAFNHGIALRWCRRYHHCDRLPLSDLEDLNHQSELTRLLATARPEYDATPIRSAPALLDHLSSLTPLPVVMKSYGPGPSGDGFDPGIEGL